jgi:hypothetical protein
MSAIIGRLFCPHQEFHTPSFGHLLQITLDGTGNSLINRLKESQQNIATVVSMPQPQVDPALYALRQGLGMMNRNDNQMGQGCFAGCNGSQLRHAKLIKEPNLLCDVTVLAKISG